jgi:hypothetical protein
MWNPAVSRCWLGDDRIAHAIRVSPDSAGRGVLPVLFEMAIAAEFNVSGPAELPVLAAA